MTKRDRSKATLGLLGMHEVTRVGWNYRRVSCNYILTMLRWWKD